MTRKGYKGNYTPCVDCGKLCSPKSLRCQPCYGLSKRGENNHRYKTGKTICRGYVMLNCMWDHPNADSRGRMHEHIYVMSQMLGRPLYPGEEVHHKNGVKTDNGPQNLELWVTSQPSGQRPEDLVLWAKQILERYENE